MGLSRVPRCPGLAGIALGLGLLGGSAGCVADPGAAPEPARPGALGPPAGPERVVVSDGWLAMGTFFEADLRVPPGSVARARAWLEEARGEIARLERIYSRHDPDSQLSALNRWLAGDVADREPRAPDAGRPAGPGSGAPASPELARLLRRARGLWRATDGAFDVTVGPWIALWRRAASEGVWPSEATRRATGGRVGLDRLMPPSADGDGIPAAAVDSGMAVDLDGLSKGVVLDRLHGSLRERLPGTAALLSFGESSVWAIGDPGGGWRLEVRSRDPARGSLGRLRLVDRALSVSSSVGSVREIEGRRVSHVIDPRSGRPVEGSVEAVVVGARATETDAWSTALLVLGARPSALGRLAAAGLEGRVLDADGRALSTPGWARIADPPTGGQAPR